MCLVTNPPELQTLSQAKFHPNLTILSTVRAATDLQFLGGSDGQIQWSDLDEMLGVAISAAVVDYVC